MKAKFLRNWYRDRPIFSSGQLKLIATFTMVLSHLAQSNLIYKLGLVRLGDVFMLIGRISMPLYCFMLVQGVILSSNRKKYLLRLLVFALVSEVFFDLAFSSQIFDFTSQNVFFTLFLGGVMLVVFENLKLSSINRLLAFTIAMGFFLLSCFISATIRSDYSTFGIIAILILYISRNSRFFTSLGIFLGFYFERFVSGYIIFIPYIVYLSIPLVFLYNGQRGSYNKYGFYLVYPLHLLVIYLLKEVLF